MRSIDQKATLSSRRFIRNTEPRDSTLDTEPNDDIPGKPYAQWSWQKLCPRGKSIPARSASWPNHRTSVGISCSSVNYFRLWYLGNIQTCATRAPQSYLWCAPGGERLCLCTVEGSSSFHNPNLSPLPCRGGRPEWGELDNGHCCLMSSCILTDS